MPARQGWGSGRHFLPTPCSWVPVLSLAPPQCLQSLVLSLQGCGLMGPSVWGKASLVSLLLPALRQWVHDLGRENQARSPAGSWLEDLQQPGSLWSTAGQGYKACTSSLHPRAHPPAPKCMTPVHPNAHLSASRCSFPLHPNRHPHIIPMHVPSSSQCTSPLHPNRHPHSIPLHPDAHPPCVPVPSPAQPRGVLACWGSLSAQHGSGPHVLHVILRNQ